MKKWIVALGALGSLAGVGAFAQATLARDGMGDAGAGRFERGMTRRFSPEDMQAFTDARIAALHAGLKLTPDQDKLWPPVETAIRGLVEQRREAAQTRRERWAAMRESQERNVPEMLRTMADRQTASGEALRKLADASAPLYAALDDGQRRRLVVLSRAIRPHEGRGRHGWHRGGRGDEADRFGGPAPR